MRPFMDFTTASEAMQGKHMVGEYIAANIQVVQCGAFLVIWCVATVWSY
jgi:hypothetical protein